MTLEKPKYKNLQQGNGSGTPVLKAIWINLISHFYLPNQVYLNVMVYQTWLITFAYVVGLIANKNSVMRISEHATKDNLLQPMFRNPQYTFSRFFTTDYNGYVIVWAHF